MAAILLRLDARVAHPKHPSRSVTFSQHSKVRSTSHMRQTSVLTHSSIAAVDNSHDFLEHCYPESGQLHLEPELRICSNSTKRVGVDCYLRERLCLSDGEKASHPHVLQGATHKHKVRIRMRETCWWTLRILHTITYHPLMIMQSQHRNSAMQVMV